MGIRVTDLVTVRSGDALLTIKVEDASKGDVIGGRIESIEGETPFQIGGVHEFPRRDIQS